MMFWGELFMVLVSFVMFKFVIVCLILIFQQIDKLEKRIEELERRKGEA